MVSNVANVICQLIFLHVCTYGNAQIPMHGFVNCSTEMPYDLNLSSICNCNIEFCSIAPIGRTLYLKFKKKNIAPYKIEF